MDDNPKFERPAVLESITRDAATLEFRMAAEDRTGAILRTLAASKPGGAFLELGTGCGCSTAWILAGMDAASSLVTVDSEEKLVAIARRHLGGDRRVEFHIADGGAFLAGLRGRTFDFIFADTWPGKFDHLEDALALLRPGGMYIIDDLLPQRTWPAGHAAKVPALIAQLERDPRLSVCKLAWSTGILIASRRAESDQTRLKRGGPVQ
jgi:predicted O-methyltransferase YrrM